MEKGSRCRRSTATLFLPVARKADRHRRAIRLSADLSAARVGAGVRKIECFVGAQAGIKRLIIGHAEDVEMDSAGRLLISPRLRAVAKLDKGSGAGRYG